MDRLVLDTNQIVEKNWRLRSAAMRLIEKAIAVELITLVIPEVVIEEAQNKFRQRLEEEIDRVQTAAGHITRLVHSQFTVSVLQIDEECEKYRKALRQRLTELDAARPEYTNVKHEWLLGKALRPHRPFQEKDRGYRDALVWHAVLKDVASREHHTYFVSANKKDFTDSEGALHADLVADLAEIGLAGHFTYFHDLQTFVETIIKPAFKTIPTPITAEEFEELFESQLSSVIDQLRIEIDKQGLSDVPNELFLGGAYIYQLGLVSAAAADAYRLDDTSYYSSFEVVVEASFDQTVDAAEAVWISERLGTGSATGGDERTTELDITLTIPLTIAVVTSTEQGVEPELSVELKEFYGLCRHCRYPVLSDAAERCSQCHRSLL